jgi:hypothetical protein
VLSRECLCCRGNKCLLSRCLSRMTSAFIIPAFTQCLSSRCLADDHISSKYYLSALTTHRSHNRNIHSIGCLKERVIYRGPEKHFITVFLLQWRVASQQARGPPLCRLSATLHMHCKRARHVGAARDLWACRRHDREEYIQDVVANLTRRGCPYA